jgi:hypothetical protein
MKSLWKYLFPRDVRGVQNPEGTAARERAEENLEREHERLAHMRAETAYYERLGGELRRLRERNHFADNIRATMREA